MELVQTADQRDSLQGLTLPVPFFMQVGGDPLTEALLAIYGFACVQSVLSLIWPQCLLVLVHESIQKHRQSSLNLGKSTSCASTIHSLGG